MPRLSPIRFQGKVVWNEATKRKRLELNNKTYFNHHIQKFDGDVSIEIAPKKKVRSYKQNARYWGGVIDSAIEDAVELTGYTKEQMHHIFKVRHLSPEVLKDPFTGEKVPVWSTKKLTPGEFVEYCHHVEQDLAKLGIKIMTPEQFYKGI